MDNVVAIHEERPLSALQLKEQVNLIQEVMRSVMRVDEHYGKIPGCGDKPSLLKPGAEKLMFTFRLTADPQVEVFDLYHPTVQGHREYRVKVNINTMSGIFVGAGVGSCSTMESKYRYRGGEKEGTGQPVPTQYWNLKKDGKHDDAKMLIGGDGYGVGKIDGKWEICVIGEKQEHDNPADFYNTCEKMAKKRALVDGTLTATAASDIFTQDIEELVDNGVMKPKPEGEKKAPLKEPEKKSTTTDAALQNITTQIHDVTSKSGTSAKGPWTLYSIIGDNETVYKTFSESYKKLADEAVVSQQLMKIIFKSEKNGNLIVGMDAAEAAA